MDEPGTGLGDGAGCDDADTRANRHRPAGSRIPTIAALAHAFARTAVQDGSDREARDAVLPYGFRRGAIDRRASAEEARAPVRAPDVLQGRPAERTLGEVRERRATQRAVSQRAPVRHTAVHLRDSQAAERGDQREAEIARAFLALSPLKRLGRPIAAAK